MIGSNKAADAQRDAANSANAQQMAMFNQIRQDLMPYNLAGQQVTPQLLALLGIGGGDQQAMLESLPGYQFALKQGLLGTQNALGARGLGLSGAALKGGAQFAAGLADQTYGNQFNRLLQAAQLGENAAAQSGNFGTQTAGNIGQNMIGAGNAQAAGIMGGANAIAGMAGGVGNMFMMNSLMQNNGMSGLFGGGGGGGGGGTLIPAGGGMNYTL